MMANWFECKIKYEKMMENGKQKKVTDSYLVDALSFTEAEARIIKEMKPFISVPFSVSNVGRKNYSEIFFTDDDDASYWYKCKVSFITIDEKTAVEKMNAVYILVQASDLLDAVSRLNDGMKGTLADYRLNAVSETNIMDVYKYEDGGK